MGRNLAWDFAFDAMLEMGIPQTEMGESLQGPLLLLVEDAWRDERFQKVGRALIPVILEKFEIFSRRFSPALFGTARPVGELGGMFVI
jgi:hypothetical protein